MKAKKIEREEKSVFCEQRSPLPLVVNSITITASKEIYGRLLATIFRRPGRAIWSEKGEEPY
jgi:hypothetical protein